MFHVKHFVPPARQTRLKRPIADAKRHPARPRHARAAPAPRPHASHVRTVSALVPHTSMPRP